MKYFAIIKSNNFNVFINEYFIPTVISYTSTFHNHNIMKNVLRKGIMPLIPLVT